MSSGATFQSPHSTSGSARLVPRVQVAPQPPVPLQLVLVRWRVHRLPVRRVGAHHPDPVHRRAISRALRILDPVRQAPHHVRGLRLREDGHPVVRLLAVQRGVVARLAHAPPWGTRSSTHLSSCRHSTSGWRLFSQSTSRSRRARTEFTFQAAIFIQPGNVARHLRPLPRFFPSRLRASAGHTALRHGRQPSHAPAAPEGAGRSWHGHRK